MSLKERVVSSIYHEKQESDSSLCAQHCLNNLVQDGLWTAADLADLARQLDEREREARGGVNPTSEAGTAALSPTSRNRRQSDPDPLNDEDYDARDYESRMRHINPHLNAGRSRNMDDSGFFSVQVMDEALRSFNLQLVRWRNAELRSLHANPEKMEAFVFNLHSHWFPIRKFGKSKDFWFDLNSFHQQPRHVSPLYLGLQIDQAEHEGYSVFVVLPTGEGAGTSRSAITTVFSLPQSGADNVIDQVADETRIALGKTRPDHLPAECDIDDEHLFTSTGHGPEVVSAAVSGFGGLGTEDEELNKAIEASLQGYQPPAASQTKSTPAIAASADFDEDPELAAAIAASLNDQPSTSQKAPPPLKSPSRDDPGMNATIPATKPEKSASPHERPGLEHDFEMATEDEAEAEDEEGEEEEEEKAPTAEEMRLKRLARFS